MRARAPGIRTQMDAEWKDLETLRIGRSGGAPGHAASNVRARAGTQGAAKAGLTLTPHPIDTAGGSSSPTPVASPNLSFKAPEPSPLPAPDGSPLARQTDYIYKAKGSSLASWGAV